MKRFWICLAVLLALLCFAALAEEAADITPQCGIRVSHYGKDKEKMLDNGTMSMWYQPEANAWVEVTCPQGKPAQGVFIRWGKKPIDTVIQVPGEDKEWQTALEHDGM